MKKMIIVIGLAVMLCLTVLVGNAADQKRGSSSGEKKVSAGGPFSTLVNINNISMWIEYDGASARNPSTGNSGVTYPRGTGTSIYADGFVWGGMVNDGGSQALRVNGGTYQQGNVGGRIISKGVAEDIGGSSVRIFRVRRDYETANLRQDAAELLGVALRNVTDGDAEAVRAQYKTDWLEWPASKGAPYYDRNNNGVYDPDPSGTYNPLKDEPGVADADQVVWFVINDLNSAQSISFEGSDPMGMEVQVTLWGYARSDQLGNVIFKKYTFIYKGTADGNPTGVINDMYVGQWSDPDLGDYSDDYEGCDTVRISDVGTVTSLGYVYNSTTVDRNYRTFNIAPPAMGYDFFAGPTVAGVSGEDLNKNGVDDAADYAVFNLKIVGPGFINLPMTSWIYFAAGGTYSDPPFDYVGAGQWYNLLRGLTPVDGSPFQYTASDPATKYWLSGDPVTGTGYLDGDIDAAGDRRMVLASGPFQMRYDYTVTPARTDTQEVVVALVGGSGSDRLSSLSVLRFNDVSAQYAYDNLFELPKAAPAPKLVIAELDKELVLNWGYDEAAVAATENDDSKGYKFEGYNVYQLPSATATIDQGIRLATYDVVNEFTTIKDLVFDQASGQVLQSPTQLGKNSGLVHYLRITEDQLNSKPLVNGQPYYFAVTAYNNNPSPLVPVHSLENPLQIVTAIPQSTNPGVRYAAQYGDTVKTVVHSSLSGGVSDGNVEVYVIDPTKLTGHAYQVTFADSGGEVVWELKDMTTNTVKLTAQANQTGDDTYLNADGLLVKVLGAPNDFKTFSMRANASGPISPSATTGFDVTPAPTAFGAYSADWYRDVALGDATVLNLDPGMQVQGGWFFLVAGGNNIASYDDAVGRWTRDGLRFSRLVPNDYEIRFKPGAKAVFPTEFGSSVPGVYDVPFEVWFTGIGTPNDASDDVRMIPVIFDEDDDNIWNFRLDHAASGGNNDPYSDWIYFYMPPNTTPGEAGYNTEIALNPTTRAGSWSEHLARLVVMNWNRHVGGGGIDEKPEAGTVFRIEMTKPNRAGADVFNFTAPANTSSTAAAKSDVTKINVFPNPYYGYNRAETSRFARFVTFNHLPPGDWRIRIFNLAGTMLKKISPFSAGQNSTGQFATWDLNNENGLPVASGIYIAHITMPQLGETKILKIVVIQEQQVLDFN